MRNPLHPTPAPPGFGDGKIAPVVNSSWISKLLFGWLDPFLQVGFSRPLEKEDLWELPAERLTDPLTDELERNFYKRCPPEKRPRSRRKTPADQPERPASVASTSSATIENEKRSTNDKNGLDTKHATDDKDDIDIEDSAGSKPPPPTGGKKARKGRKRSESGATEKDKKPKYDSSLLKALNRCYFWLWWTSGILTLLGNTLQTTTPLVNQRLLNWLEERCYYWQVPSADRTLISQPQGIGYGIGLAFAIFVMQEASSLMTCHYTLMSMERTLAAGTQRRKDHAMISADATRLERNTYYAHNLWVAPIQIVICLALLIKTLGYSALVGLGVFVLGFPVQVACAIVMFQQRSKGVVLTDKRVRTVTEVLQGIRLIKFFGWEEFFEHEVVTILPVLAAVLSFITYGLSGHDLNVSIIFTALQYFNIIRQPLMFFPMVVASCTDSIVALGRISDFLTSEELDEPYTIQSESKFAVDVEGDFTWETAHKPPPEELPDLAGADRGKHGPSRGRPPQDKKDKQKADGKRSGGWFGRKKKDEPVLPTEGSQEKTKDEEQEERPFELKDLNFKVSGGSFAVVLGPIGSGKSSLMQALIGEMRRTRGHTVLSSSVAYVPQNAWIMNATLRENIVFGREDKEERFRAIVKACCLERDLEMLPYGEKTEIGEKGINLSGASMYFVSKTTKQRLIMKSAAGGQKARVSLARAAYSDADIILMDDSLSAIDAHTGKMILDNLFLNGPLAGKTRVLVTHALHVLDKADHIFVMKDGTIVERGSFEVLMKDSVTFSRMIEEYGNMEKEKVKAEAQAVEKVDESVALGASKESDVAQPQLMQEEERLTGSVSWKTYGAFFRYAGGLAWAPLLLLLVALMQGAQVANNLFLGYWTAGSIKGFNQGDYMGTYAALGVASALFSFGVSYALTTSSLLAGYSMFQKAFAHVMHSSVSFFDTTPIGRIISRLSRDQDTIDAEISMTLFVLLSTLSSVVGTIFLVFYTFPYLGIIFVPLGIFYMFAAVYYRRSSVETKRLDSILRSKLYSAYAESLTGISTNRFIQKTEYGLDVENRAYYMVIAIQQWLSTRLDLLGNILVLGIALFAAGFSKTISPSKVGVVLSYTLSITQVFSQVVQTYAQNEQNFNAVERILHYAELPSEGDYTKPDDPPAAWPEKGEIQFKDVDLAYREGLPLVLKQVSFSVRPGEKIGIVGRTGAGKSSLMQALFRTVNIAGGSVEIDGVDTRNIGLKTLRNRLALVPQDNVLFKGTLRQNLDPEGTRTDAELISALQRTWLLPKDGMHDAAAEAKFSLDSLVGDEGSNYSAGEKQMLALCRALAKNSRIIVLDEATSNVDLEMDAKLQRTIQKEFALSTLLCIAHRLNTIVYYDRVLLMDAGHVAEFDTPLNLFDKEDSIFRSLCDQAGLSRQDILRIRSNVPVSPTVTS
ncbi:hypothetical protein EVJ58_g8525 [Rhodofomes roseus]|uniref:Multidrug resistance-associated ABC transporter n=1 Tax=Rhodofomes roseus TaxID=34475 RepID=A0A4Y9Y095_9APHY|nr:hypothetical protein EVJ58_g8525 [Rhodofomes roseus]